MKSVSSWLLTLSVVASAAGADNLQVQSPAASSGRVDNSTASRLFHYQYHRSDSSFCNSQVCVDFDNDGKRELLFASRATGRLEMLNAADGTVLWSKPFVGQQQSLSAWDLDGDGRYEILYSVSSPGLLYLVDCHGNIRRTFDSGDQKLGNSPVVLDADGDGVLDGLLGTRSKYLLRLNMADFSLSARRDGWSQCGCYTSAMDVDGDGRWDLFAGSGDDFASKGVVHRFDPLNLRSIWSFETNDNASSADAVLADINGDGQVEIIKSVDNYKGDDAHDAVYAFTVSGRLLWKVTGLSGEDSPNVADLDGDGTPEIVGMTFGGEVYCLDPGGGLRWKTDLRPELDDTAHAYLAPILCDLDGDRQLEILALTNGSFADAAREPGPGQPHGVIFALSAAGEVLDRFDVGGPRYWGDAFVCNLDDDPSLELVASGSGGLDVIETRGYGPDTEHFQRRRSYQRLNVVPWAYEDSYFLYRGKRQGVTTLADSLVLAQQDAAERVEPRYRDRGTYTTELFTLPPGCSFCSIGYKAEAPPGTAVRANILDALGNVVVSRAVNGQPLSIDQPLRVQFLLETRDAAVTPKLDSYRVAFRRAAGGVQIGTFHCDLTPPVNVPVGLGFIPVATTVEHPLMAKGIVLKDETGACVLCAVDWMEVHNAGYDLLREKIAAAAGSDPSRVAVQTLHQHTAPALDPDAQRLQLEDNDPRRVATAKYLAESADKIASAVRTAMDRLEPLTQIGTSRARVERVASNRRIEQADGSILARMSSTKDASLRELPEGQVDPWLRTVSFYSGERGVAQLHYFATHPQSFYGDGRVSYDVPGIARERLEKETGVAQIYFTGCAGDVAMGKYNDGTIEARAQLAARLYDAMRRSSAAVSREPVSSFRWETALLRFPARQDDAFKAEANRAILSARQANFPQRLKAAVNLAWIERHAKRGGVPLSCLSIGRVRIVHLPGEPFVEYQLAAARMRPDLFVAVAGYGDCGMGYIGGDRIYTDRGGYEQTFAFAGPCQQPLLAAIKSLLQDSQPSPR